MAKNISNPQPTPTRQLVKNTLSIWLQHLEPYKKTIALSMFVKVGANIASNIAIPIFVGLIINHLATHAQPDMSYVTRNIMIIGVLLLGGILLEYFWNRLCAKYLARTRRNLEQYVFSELLNKSYRFHAGSFGGATVSQFNRFIGAFNYFHDSIFRDIFSIGINFIASLAVTFVYSPLIGGVMLAWTICYVFAISTITRKRFHKKRAGSKNHSKTTGYLADVLGNIATVKIFARESYEKQTFRAITENKMKSAEKAWIWSGATSALISFFMAVLNLSVLIISVSLVNKSIIDIGTLVLIQAFTLRLSVQLWQLGNIIRDIDRSFAESNEMTEILTNQPQLTDPDKPKRTTLSEGRISLKDVRFEYPDEFSIPRFFDQLSIQIEPGEKVGIVGPSGSGKTTLIKLILRLADINGGQILIDGNDITKLRHGDLRRAISYVPQEPLLFHRTVLDNVRYANPDATKEHIQQVLKKSRSNIFIERLPKGLDTIVGERGFRLSAGQRQRIAIARAMLKPSPILIMDEATSAIDSESEQLIQQAMDELMQSRTTIVVAHRFSTIKKMDRIIFMSYGKIIEQGTHKELLKKKGPYAKLWAHQSGETVSFES